MEIVLTAILGTLIPFVLRTLDHNKRRYYYFCAIPVVVGLLLVLLGVYIRVESVKELRSTSIVLKRFETNATDRFYL
jgi:hypothetical protein